MEWLSDPTAWLGLGTLVVLEIVLGIDNLIFIAILADKLPEHQRNKARLIGLSLALFMRLGLLASISWIVSLTAPLFSLGGFSFSGRDLILLGGGLFLLYKATSELHERLEGAEAHHAAKVEHAVFWQVIVQILLLDLVFSLDSVITAVGMVDELSIMMIAVIISILVMLVSSKPLMAFVTKHPTVVILCLGFLLMIGFSLVAEGFGFHIPKGYLYAAIGFSVLIEAANQIMQRNKRKVALGGDRRQRAADAVLRMLGGRVEDGGHNQDQVAASDPASGQPIFAAAERSMIQGVLDLGERPVRSIMTPRTELAWLDLTSDEEALRQKILESGHSRLLLGRGSLDELAGVALARDLLRDLSDGGRIDLERSVRQPLVVHEGLGVLSLMERLRGARVQLAVVLDEYGSIEGVVTPSDILESIAGEFPDERDETVLVERQADASWLVDAAVDVRRLSRQIEVDLVDEADKYSTLAGYLLWQIGHLPQVGETHVTDKLSFEIVSMNGRRIETVRIRTVEPAPAAPAA